MSEDDAPYRVTPMIAPPDSPPSPIKMLPRLVAQPSPEKLPPIRRPIVRSQRNKSTRSGQAAPVRQPRLNLTQDFHHVPPMHVTATAPNAVPTPSASSLVSQGPTLLDLLISANSRGVGLDGTASSVSDAAAWDAWDPLEHPPGDTAADFIPPDAFSQPLLMTNNEEMYLWYMHAVQDFIAGFHRISRNWVVVQGWNAKELCAVVRLWPRPFSLSHSVYFQPRWYHLHFALLDSEINVHCGCPGSRMALTMCVHEQYLREFQEDLFPIDAFFVDSELYSLQSP